MRKTGVKTRTQKEEPLNPSSRPEKKKAFIRQLAVYLAGTNQAKHSIGLQMGNPASKEWAELRDKTPLFGYPSVEEATSVLSDFLG